MSGFLGYLGGNIGQFAIDAAIRHLNLDSFLSGKACSNHRQGMLRIYVQIELYEKRHRALLVIVKDQSPNLVYLNIKYA